MCFSIPLQVTRVKKQKAVLENGDTVLLDDTLVVRKGDFVRIAGSAIVDRLSKKEGEAIRKLIGELNREYA